MHILQHSRMDDFQEQPLTPMGRGVSSYLVGHDLNLGSRLPSPEGYSTSLDVYFFHALRWVPMDDFLMQTCTLICHTGSSENSGDPSLLMVWMHAPKGSRERKSYSRITSIGIFWLTENSQSFGPNYFFRAQREVR